MKRTTAYSILGISLLLLIGVAFAQVTPFNHAELLWRTIEGKHHIVHYHVGAERTAQMILDIADEVHQPLADLYKYEPDTKVNWVIYDTDDYANGATYFLNNRIVIWAPALDFEFRGTHNWLRNVVTHEYTHMIQLGAARKWSRQMPAIYGQYIGYEPETRPDVLYGFPNRIMSYPLSNTTVPHWFAEGTAQSMRRGMNYDYRDSHREMLLRSRALADNLLTMDEMGVFEKTSLGGELVYNQGFALVQYIIDRFGETALRTLSESLGSMSVWSFDAACRKTLGIPAQKLYDEWVRAMKETYRVRTETIRQHEVTGRLLEEDGFANLYPRWSIDGKKIYFTSNKEKDYFGGSSLVEMNLATGKKEKLVKTMAPFAVHPNGKGLIYSEQPLQKGQRRLDDLFFYDFAKKKSYRLTYAERAQQPDVSSDGKKIVAVTQSDGTMNLVVFELPDSIKADVKQKAQLKKRVLTSYVNGEQLSHPRFSPDGNKILYSFAREQNRDLFEFDLTTNTSTLLRASKWDDRDVAWSKDGQWIYFSSDSTGIWNIYRMRSDRTIIEPVTNVVGGALLGEPSPDGAKLAFCRYESTGYKLALLDKIEPVDRAYMQYQQNYAQSLPNVSIPDSMPPAKPVMKYKPAFEKTYILPRIAWDYGRFKPGFYVYTNDYLEKLNLFGGFAINGKKDYDLYLSTDYRQLPPTLFMDFYNIVRHDDKRFDDPLRIVGQSGHGDSAQPIYAQYGTKYKFTLLELDIGFRYNIDEKTVASLYGMFSRYSAALDFDDGSSSFGYTYFKGHSLVASLTQTAITRSVTDDINPSGGYQFGIRAQRSQHNYIQGFTINADKLTLQEVYSPYNYWQLEGSFNYYQKLWHKWVMSPSVKLGYIDRNVDPFMNLYAGGLFGMRGYSFYSLGGTRTTIAQLAQELPLWEPMGKRQYLGWVHPISVYANLFADVGSAWRGDVQHAKWVRDLGGELRFGSISVFSYPTAITLSAARGLDRVSVTENDNTTVYAPQWRYYFTILFGFTQPPTGIQPARAIDRQ